MAAPLRTPGAPARQPRCPALAAADLPDLPTRFVMPRNVQLLWIAEAEARQLQESTLAQRAPSEPPISIIAAVHGAASGNRWRRLLAQLMGNVPDSVTRADTAVDAALREIEAAKPAPAPAGPQVVVCLPVNSAYDDQRS
jgi:hypothetical protein